MVAVVVPWRPGCPHREAAWQWVRSRYEALGWTVVTGAPPEGEWCKALAVDDALDRVTDDILVIADADCWCDATSAAVEGVNSGAAWARPHDNVHRLTQESTLDLLNGQEPTSTVRAPYYGMEGGGIVVVPRSVYETIPLDPRATGWGGEDAAWGKALRCIHGDPWEGRTPLLHLWHPPQHDAPPEAHRGPGGGRWMNDGNWQLLERYKSARGRPDVMRQVLDEAREVLHEQRQSRHQPAGHPGAAPV